MAVLSSTRTSADLPEPPADRFDVNTTARSMSSPASTPAASASTPGGFIEVSYSGIERHTAWGAFDVRYARSFTLAATASLAASR